MLSDILEWTLAIVVGFSIALIFGLFGVMVTGLLLGAIIAYVLMVAGDWFSSLFLSNGVRKERERRDDDDGDF